MPIIHMTRDSLCLADDVDAPHDQSFDLPAPATLLDLGRHVASSSYLPMQWDTWGWIIEAGGAAVAIRPRMIFFRRAEGLFGDPGSVMLEDGTRVSAVRSREDRQKFNRRRGAD